MKLPRRWHWRCLVVGGVLFAARTFAGDATPLCRAPDDGWLDVSGFIDKAYGFVPLLVPITEPAVGIGAAAALVFIDQPEGETQGGFARPDSTLVGGLSTGNGTRGAFVGDMRHWLDGRVKTLFGFAQARRLRQRPRPVVA